MAVGERNSWFYSSTSHSDPRMAVCSYGTWASQSPPIIIEQSTMSPIEINAGQLGIRYLIDGSDMFELTVPSASNVPPPHSHSNNEEIVYVLEGALRYSVGSETRDLTCGQSMHTPQGTVHAFSNPFDGVARALIILSPDIEAQYFRDAVL